MLKFMVVLFVVIGGTWVVSSVPSVEYRGNRPVQCIVRMDANGVNALSPSDPRCKAIIKGFHFSEVVD